MNFSKISYMASIAIAGTILFTGCGSSGGSNSEETVSTITITGTAFDGPLYNVSIQGYDENGAIDSCNTQVTIAGGGYSLDCSSLPTYLELKPIINLQALDLGIDGLVGGGDDTIFTDTLYTTVNTDTLSSTNITPLTHLQYITNNTLDLGTGYTEDDARDIILVANMVKSLKNTGLSSQDAYQVVAQNLDSTSTFKRIDNDFYIDFDSLKTAILNSGLNIDDNILQSVVVATNNVSDVIVDIFLEANNVSTSNLQALYVTLGVVSNVIDTAIQNSQVVNDVSGLASLESVGVLTSAIDDVMDDLENNQVPNIGALIDAMDNLDTATVLTSNDIPDIQTTPIGTTNINYGTITSTVTQKVWLDRNLGASSICTSYNDSQCYGDYYQWGREADGHEKSNSSVVSTQSTSTNPNHSKFIISSDWTTADSDGAIRNASWNPCPSGFRIPTMDELEAENIANRTDAYNKLKLPSAGNRSYDTASMYYRGVEGNLWSSTTNSTSSKAFNFYSSSKNIRNNLRAYGFSIRCISNETLIDTTSPIFTSNTVAISVDENQTSVFTASATANSEITYSLSGTDANSFNIDSSTGVVTFKVAPDYETEENYSFSVIATNSASNTATQDVTITILDVEEQEEQVEDEIPTQNNTLIDLKFTTAWLNGRTLYNVLLEDNEWELSIFTTTSTTWSIHEDGNEANGVANIAYTITTEGYMTFSETEDTTSFIRAYEQTADYLKICWEDESDARIASQNCEDEEYFFFDYQKAKDYIASH